MNTLAIVIPYFNHTKCALTADVFRRGVERWRSIYSDVFVSEISNCGEYVFANEPNSFCFKGYSVIWYKENAINLAVKRLPDQFSEVAWIDADCEILHEDIIGAIHDALSRADVVQCASNIVYLGFNGEKLNEHPLRFSVKHDVLNGACGLCVAARREAFNKLGGLPEFQVCGGGDLTFAASLGYVINDLCKPQMSFDFSCDLMGYVARGQNAHLTSSFIQATAIHHYHADPTKRMYVERYASLESYSRDSLVRDEHGVLRLQNAVMEEKLKSYFYQRCAV